MKPSDFKVGQVIFVVEDHSGRHSESVVSVCAVGRRWVSYGNPAYPNRFDPADMRIDGGQYSSPGRVWLSKAEYDQYRSRAMLTGKIKDILARVYDAPRNVTAEELKDFLALLGG